MPFSLEHVWEAVTAERDLPGVLRSIASVLLPVVPFESLGIIGLGEEPSGLVALHVVGIPPVDGETLTALLKRMGTPEQVPVANRPLVRVESEIAMAAVSSGTPYICNDLLAKPGWYEHEFIMARSGVRAYASVPLRRHGQCIAAAVYCRAKAQLFTEPQVAALRKVAGPLSVAVENAFANEQVRTLTYRLEAENKELRRALGEAPWFGEICGSSAAIRRVLDQVDQVAPTGATVLIEGATGTGKELVARAIHRRSLRAHGPLVKVNCAALPDTLLISELFGHERGAFTGALERRKGRFEQAHGGTLFLDEIGEMSPEAQAMLLRVLQEREFERLGGSQTVRVDVRIVAATNRNLAEQVETGEFRRDLFYRLNVFPICIPPLRERLEDLAPLAAHFAEKHGKRLSKPIDRIDSKFLDALMAHDWPGNVRELENLLERAVILSRNGEIRWDGESAPALASAKGRKLRHNLHSQERAAIESALQACRGRVSGPKGAAIRLGLRASTLEFRIKRLGIDKLRYRAV